jgi:hypothetical protein
LNPIIKAAKTKNIFAEGGKMVAKRKGDRVEKEICIFFKLDHPSTIFRSG